MNARLKNLAAAGISIWLDDLSRELLNSGKLAELIADYSVVGVTTNPTIFASALSKGEAYAQQVKALKADGAGVDEAIKALTSSDVREACTLFADTFAATNGFDGRVSIEVEPGLARHTEATIAQAQELSGLVGKDNVLIKIPATKEGLSAITATIAAGISVNVTLIFALERYADVIDAYLAGLEQAAENGHDLSKLHSVASFFVSRVDSEVDKRLAAIGTDEATALRGKAGVANARLAYKLYTEKFAEDRFAALKAKGANPQRPLWASTGVKDPAYPDTLYVAELIAEPCVNTMPEKTMFAFADHGEVSGDTIRPNIADAEQEMAALAAVGVDMADVVRVLEDEGVEKFAKSWDELVETVRQALEQA
jgi:transaldolase